MLKLVAEYADELAGIVAASDVDLAVRPGERLNLSRQLYIAVGQDKIFGSSAGLVAVEERVARQQRQHFIVADFLADARHAQEGTQRSGNLDRLRLRRQSRITRGVALRRIS